MRRIAHLGLFALLGLTASCGKGASPSSSSEDAGAHANARDANATRPPSTSPSSSTSAPADSGSPPDSTSIPPDVPQGWIRWNGYGSTCNFFVPPTPDLLPKPLVWEDCPASAGRPCKRLARVTPNGWSFYYDANNEGGTNRFLIGMAPKEQLYNKTTYTIAGDGTVLSAFYNSGPNCRVAWANLSGSHGLYSISSSQRNAGKFALTGAISFDLDPPAWRTLAKESPPTETSGHGFKGAQSYFFDWGTRSIYDWETSQPIVPLAASGKDASLELVRLVPWQDSLFAQLSHSDTSVVYVYTRSGGYKRFIPTGDFVTTGAASFGTDGQDMAWLQGEGRTNVNAAFPKVFLYTAPFTLDPHAVAPRKVTLYESAFYTTDHVVVGCGYAAFGTDDGTSGNGTRLVRLSDGQSWTITSRLTDEFVWSSPVAVSCDDVFLGGSDSASFNLARVRIDSLGPGTPAVLE